LVAFLQKDEYKKPPLIQNKKEKRALLTDAIVNKAKSLIEGPIEALEI
jgi:hypothetical protein